MMKIAATVARPILLPVERPATTKYVESIGAGSYRKLGEGCVARARLVDAGLRRSDGLDQLAGPQVEQLVERSRDHATGQRADVPDPPVVPRVADEHRAEGARRVHRSAREEATHVDVEGD